MKRNIAITLIALSLLLTACATPLENETVQDEPSRMVIVERAVTYRIVYDKYTKVMYAVSNGNYSRGTFTLLVDANGNPLLYKE